MRRQLLVGIVIIGGVVLGAGFVVWATTSGVLGGPQAKAKRVLSLAQQEAQHGQLAQAQAKLEALANAQPDSPVADEALLRLGEVYEQQQQLAQARATYTALLERFPNSLRVTEAQAKLGGVNVALLFSPTVTETDTVYVVKPGDSLGKIAAAQHTTVDLLQQANGLKDHVIHPNQKLKVTNTHFRIHVDKSQNRLLVTRDNAFFKAYVVSTGKDNSTPVGTFTIVNKVPKPVWYHQGAVVPPDSPENILGTRWMGFNKPGYGIHGTTDPGALGQQVTAGCVRMSNAEVEELFSMVPIGTEVTIED